MRKMIRLCSQRDTFLKKALLRKRGLDARLHFAMDWDLILKFMRSGARFRRLPYFLACFRTHPAQKTSLLLESHGP